MTEACEETGLSNYLGVFMTGMILHGVGGCILYTVGVGLLDDSVEATKSPLYLGMSSVATLARIHQPILRLDSKNEEYYLIGFFKHCFLNIESNL